MIRTLAVNCAPIIDYSKDDGKTMAEHSSDVMVMGAVRLLFEFSLLVCQQNQTNLSLKALDDALKRVDQKNCIFREQKVSKSAKAKVDGLLATESHQLCKQQIHKILAAMEALVYGAEKVSTTKCRQFQVCLNSARQAATTSSNADRQKSIQLLEREIHQVTPAKSNLFDKLFQHHVWQLLQEVGTKATGLRIKLSKAPALTKTAAEDKAYRTLNMTANNRLHFQVHVSDAEIEDTTRSLADTEPVTNQLERKIYGTTWNEQKQFKTEFSIHLIKFEAWWETMGIQALGKTIEQHLIHFGYPKMHLLSHISPSIRGMGSGDNFTTDITEQLHLANVKGAYQSSNRVNYGRQMPKHNARCTGLDFMEETLSHLALDGWYDIDSAKGFNLLSATYKWRSTHRAHLSRLQTIQADPISCPVSQQIYHLREMHVCGVCRSFKLSSLRDASEDFIIPNFGQLFHWQIEED